MPPAIALLAALVTSTSAPATDGKSGLVCDADGSASVRLRPESTAYWQRGRGRSCIYREQRGSQCSVRGLARKHAADALSMLDVGAYDPTFISSFSWIASKVATDREFSAAQQKVWERARGVSFVKGDFLQLGFPVRFDLVICNQVRAAAAQVAERKHASVVTTSSTTCPSSWRGSRNSRPRQWRSLSAPDDCGVRVCCGQVVEHLPAGVVEPFVRKLMAAARVLIVSTTYMLPCAA
jgi:hypothetical protein